MGELKTASSCVTRFIQVLRKGTYELSSTFIPLSLACSSTHVFWSVVLAALLRFSWTPAGRSGMDSRLGDFRLASPANSASPAGVREFLEEGAGVTHGLSDRRRQCLLPAAPSMLDYLHKRKEKIMLILNR
ncbi:hypothetical protein NPIL_687981 [Nephila pilipes]|uniref:Uncharacterized protein n=1 Tax=Nephila pilipes TaxID=299642 RepID=A0A8X6MU26_NEPPI|nr:hypothetical protein NPIL_687981 [Nephila pilipes]